MNELDSLTTAFLQAHPAEAAREVERLPVPDAAALLSGAPARTAAPMVAEMRPQPAARALMAVDRERATLLLGAMSAPRAAAILRHVPAGLRAEIVAGLPTALMLACRALLRFPEDAVGACMQAAEPVVVEGTTTGDALDALRTAPEGAEGVLVVDASQRLLGWVSAASLLRAAPTVRLKALMSRVAELPALMPVGAAVEVPGLGDAPVAAVVEQDRRLLGTVTPALLRRALGARPGPPDAAATSMLGFVAAQYWRAVAGLADTVVGAVAAPARDRP